MEAPNPAAAMLRADNRRMLAKLAVVAVAMFGFGFALVPLYDIFCKATGFGGTPKVAQPGDRPVLDRTVAVRFDGETSVRTVVVANR